MRLPGRCEKSEQRWAEGDARDHFADDGRLADAFGEPAHGATGDEHSRQLQEEADGDFKGCHGNLKMSRDLAAARQERCSGPDMTVSVTRQGFSFSFGPAGAAVAERRLGIPVLAGPDHETLFEGLKSAGQDRGFELFGSEDWLVGVRLEPVTTDMAAQSEAIYTDLIAVARARGRSLTRIWNYMPEINGVSTGGLETYRVFCLGRAKAFDRAQWTGPLPAASAVGGAPGMIAVMFAAARNQPVARENPEQVPAYEYPADYGPRAPSFSRAMQVVADGRRWTFISGTAAIKGHTSLAIGDLPGQIECTLDNLRLISEACELGDGKAERHFKVYLRNAGDLVEAKAALDGRLLKDGDQVTWLQADICRAELLIEIEATILA